MDKRKDGVTHDIYQKNLQLGNPATKSITELYGLRRQNLKQVGSLRAWLEKEHKES